MKRSRRAMATMSVFSIIAIMFGLITLSNAGPLGLLSNATSPQRGLNAGSCAVGDVVYMAGDEFPGSTACDRCQCIGGEVRCAKQSCEPRPGCKALHRPDQCCPTYQCECEQEGRIYGNGEKLVDPADPCRVCYCQGGEVVCRRIACFVRDDCRPRLVPGRCCPEYDNCPLRGVATVPGVAPSISSISTPIIEDVGTSVAPSVPKENIRQEITIKEITPVSEIPVLTDVKVKEILPSPSIEVAEYSSSKSPLITREATSEKSVSNEAETTFKTETSAVSSFTASPSLELPTKSNDSNFKITDESLPSKISLSMQDSINIYPSNIPRVATSGSTFETSDVPLVVVTTKAPAVIEEEDTSLIEHNPAFPPLPDDLSVQSNHDDEIALDQEVAIPTVAFVTTKPTVKESPKTTSEYISSSKSSLTTTITLEDSKYASTNTSESLTSTEKSAVKESPMLNLRSAIPTEILNIPSLVVEEINGELEDATEHFSTIDKQEIYNTTSNIVPLKSEEKNDFSSELHRQLDKTIITEPDTTTPKSSETTERPRTSTIPEKTTNSVAKSNFATEVAFQTEISSLPVETSNIKPSEVIDTDYKKPISTSTVVDSVVTDIDPVQVSALDLEPEITTTQRNLEQTISAVADETTEFIQFYPPEVTTDAEPVELIKLSPNDDKKAAIIQKSGEKNNVLTDLIKLVDDVASISDHTDSPEVAKRTTVSSSISDSEELIPVNAGYKSKNNNWNLNSITEIPIKSKNSGQSKQKVIEIEDDGEAAVTDPLPPNDKVEPTTRRPIIDNVSDIMPENKIEKKDIEIITQSYVPTINRRPTKVVLKKEEVNSADRGSSSAAPAVAETRVASSTELPVQHTGQTDGTVELASTTSPADK